MPPKAGGAGIHHRNERKADLVDVHSVAMLARVARVWSGSGPTMSWL